MQQSWLEQQSTRLMSAHECATDAHKVDRWVSWVESIYEIVDEDNDVTRAVLEKLTDGSLDDVLRAWLARRP